MKILMVNKFFYIKGGSERYYFALKKMLEIEGHTVVDFSMKDNKNFESPYEKFFVKNCDYQQAKGLREKVRLAINIIYSFEAKKKFEALVKQEKPDLIHLHIFQHQISPSILDVAKKYHIPVVYTAHDLKMICPNYKMMHHNTICEDCKGGNFFHCAKNRCVKDSFFKSCINVIEGYFHKWKKSYDAIDVIITPSEFYKNKFIEFGISSERIVYIPNFLDGNIIEKNKLDDNEQYYLYFGRLSEEKGILTLIKAVNETKIPLKIVGTGPLEKQLLEYIEANSISNVKMLGFKKGQELYDVIGNAKAIVLPSEWYENGPYSAIESLQLGRPIIGANTGGIPELIADNGMLFEAGNENSLIETLERFEGLTPTQYQFMEKKSYELFSKKYTAEVHLNKLNTVYHKLGKNYV